MKKFCPPCSCLLSGQGQLYISRILLTFLQNFLVIVFSAPTTVQCIALQCGLNWNIKKYKLDLVHTKILARFCTIYFSFFYQSNSCNKKVVEIWELWDLCSSCREVSWRCTKLFSDLTKTWSNRQSNSKARTHFKRQCRHPELS